jgi:hypothetical protein
MRLNDTIDGVNAIPAGDEAGFVNAAVLDATGGMALPAPR